MLSDIIPQYKVGHNTHILLINSSIAYPISVTDRLRTSYQLFNTNSAIDCYAFLLYFYQSFSFIDVFFARRNFSSFVDINCMSLDRIAKAQCEQSYILHFIPLLCSQFCHFLICIALFLSTKIKICRVILLAATYIYITYI